VQIGTPTISGNTIINNSVTPTSAGINIALANPKVINNTISNNSIGITVNGSAGTDPVINNNSIFCNIVEDMNTSILQAFDATNNSWDHASPLPITGGALPCPAGTDICILGPTAPTLAPYGPVVATPCTP
jgi:nitrous oxidase accessory protein NosD